MSLSGKKQIRVLHIIPNLNREGIQVWLSNVVRRSQNQHIHYDFLCLSGMPTTLSAELKALHSRVCFIRSTTRVGMLCGLLRYLHKYKRDTIVHAHIHHFSGIILLIARLLGFTKLVAHSHSDIRTRVKKARMWRKLYYRVTSSLIRSLATCGLACSQAAAVSLFGNDWQQDSRWKVLYCGIDLENVKKSILENRSGHLANTRESEKKFLIGHVGRYSPVKNHRFMLDVFVCLRDSVDRFNCLFVGDGPEYERIRGEVHEMGLDDLVLYARDEPNVYSRLAGMDLFLYPSLYEGLGLSLVEAQAMGVFSIISENIPQDAIVIPELVCMVPLEEGPAAWAKAIELHLGRGTVISAENACERIANSSFNITESVAQLERMYMILIDK